MDALFDEIPAENLREQLHPGNWGFRHSGDTAYYFAMSSLTVVCFKVTEVTLKQARAIEEVLANVRDWSSPEVEDVIRRALGLRADAAGVE
jgi:hypothetical protein